MKDGPYKGFSVEVTGMNSEIAKMDYGPRVTKALADLRAAVDFPETSIHRRVFEQEFEILKRRICEELGERIHNVDILHHQAIEELDQQHRGIDAVIEKKREEEKLEMIRLHQEEMARLHRELASMHGTRYLNEPKELVEAVCNLGHLPTSGDRAFACELLKKWAAAPRSG